MDEDASLGPHVYEIRGRILVSKSERTACAVRVDEPGPREEFRRGDADSNGRLEITDPIRVLGYLFLGGGAPPGPGPAFCGPDPTPDGLDPCSYECR